MAAMASRIIFLLALEARSSSSVSKIEKPGAVNCVGDAVSDAARSELGNSLPGATAVPALCPRETVDMKGGFDAVSCTFSFATGCQGEFSAPPPGCVKAGPPPEVGNACVSFLCDAAASALSANAGFIPEATPGAEGTGVGGTKLLLDLCAAIDAEPSPVDMVPGELLTGSAPLRNNPRATRSVPLDCSRLMGLVKTRLAPMRNALATPA